MQVHVRVKTMEDKIAEYVDYHTEEIYVDYRDYLSDKQVSKILDGKANEVIWDIEDRANACVDDLTYYWDQCKEETGCSQEDIDDWLSGDGYYPSHELKDDGWERLLNNTAVCITGTVWDAEWNFDNWSCGGPVNYSDVKESLKILGVNPLEFKKSKPEDGYSFKGWFPDMPERVPKVDVKDLLGNTITLFDGVMNFCLGNLGDIIDVLSSDSKYITFTKGTEVVMYNFGSGAGITEVELTGDVTIPRQMVTLRNDLADKYGIQECYGFTRNLWEQGGVRNGS